MSKVLPPFTCTHTPNLPELLYDLECSLVISTYQAGKVIVIGAKDRNSLVQLPRSFQKPMGIALQNQKMAIASQYEVLVLGDAPPMAPNYPSQPQTYDALYLPRATYYTGALDIHDLHWVDDRLIAVNTQFSCISSISADHSFVPVWQPSFIKDLNPTDDCHLNGLAMNDGIMKYASALGSANKPQEWRKNKAKGGVIIDIDSNELVAQELAMPHSPRLYNNELYTLLSATGELVKIDLDSGKYTVVTRLDGFVRGMSRHDDYLFVGLSKLRANHNSFSDLPVSHRSLFCGIVVIHLPTGGAIGSLKYENSVEEIYDIQVMPGKRRPTILNTQKHDHRVAITSPVGDFWAMESKA